MIEIQILGRGGQGAFMGAKILANAIFRDGRYSQAFPYFGIERRGTPVKSYCRVSHEPVRLHQQLYKADHLIVLDLTLLDSMDAFKGVKDDGVMIINTSKDPKTLKFRNNMKVYVVDATPIALETLGRSIVNTAMLGAFAKVTGEVKLDSLIHAINDNFKGELAEKNILAVKRCYREVKKWR